MKNVIIERHMLPLTVSLLLPNEILWAVEEANISAVEEIRIRQGHCVWVSCGKNNIRLDVRASIGMIEEILVRACGGSLYSAEESIKRGYVFAGAGVRIGVYGEWSVGGIRNISGLVIRIPHDVRTDASVIRRLLERFKMSRGVLVFSPPLGGKTSFLREAVRELASGERALRVVVVDTRGELEYGLGGELCVDVLSHYPRHEGIEIAARTLGAQVVVCDEIGLGEAETICEIHGGGVPLLASAHASDISDLLSKRGIDVLHSAGVFGGYLELLREGEVPYKCHLCDNDCDF